MAEEKAQRMLAEWMETYGTALLRMCAVYLHDTDLAQDAVQDTFVKAYRHMDSFRGEASGKTWLIRIAIHTCRDYQRSAWFRHIDRSKPVDTLPEQMSAAAFPDDTVIAEVSRLPRKYREVILLRYYQCMRIHEAAETLGISESAVKQRQKKASDMLRAKLKGWYFDEE